MHSKPFRYYPDKSDPSIILEGSYYTVDIVVDSAKRALASAHKRPR